MKLLFWQKRTIQVPAYNDTKPVEVAQLWLVRWSSGNSTYVSHSLPQVEAFTSQQEAEDFKQSLLNALTLLRYRPGDSSDRERGYCPYKITIEAQTQDQPAS